MKVLAVVVVEGSVWQAAVLLSKSEGFEPKCSFYKGKSACGKSVGTTIIYIEDTTSFNNHFIEGRPCSHREGSNPAREISPQMEGNSSAHTQNLPTPSFPAGYFHFMDCLETSRGDAKYSQEISLDKNHALEQVFGACVPIRARHWVRQSDLRRENEELSRTMAWMGRRKSDECTTFLNDFRLSPRWHRLTED